EGSVLVIVSIYNYHREVEPIIDFTRNHSKVTVVIGWLGATADAAAETYRGLGCDVVRLPLGIAYSQSSATNSNRTKSRIVSRMIGAMKGYLRMLQIKTTIRDIFDEVNPDLVLQGPFHCCGTFDNAAFNLAGSRGIPRFCYPVSCYHGRNGAIAARFE